ncbi:hypothetical protein HanRHA438_Chr13g0598321 [Helianthus annuus]|uniref:Uncharacterized protein n=1 Tax=Helianthus annuus TaxID=4232 RepID=A0A9K3HBT3_HELAN|nr:hypothetical protein HanXRQr2_Chr13g0587701 [Helianthus annuus]KAJ0849169.1 hypothetical protein HanPSC8_Chr13g0565821 [Helianthus annuus]KAJ0858182.1 hypothetical protein HanRHA438_Chr13g0598321 [Helianthus annuus]
MLNLSDPHKRLVENKLKKIAREVVRPMFLQLKDQVTLNLLLSGTKLEKLSPRCGGDLKPCLLAMPHNHK